MSTITEAQWIPLDVALRGTSIDPQEFADRTGLVVIVDEDAATVGAECWFGIKADAKDARAAYVASGGTASSVYVPGK